MRRLLVPLLGLVALALPGCASLAPEPATPAPGHLGQILASGELRVGLTGNQPPLNMRNRAGEIFGFEVDIARALGDSMGLETRLVPLPFAELLPALERGDVDIVISGMTITAERNARVAFAGPYLVSGKSILTRSPELARAETVAELDSAGRTYVALAGSTSESFVKRRLPSAQLRGTPDYDSAVEMVRKGEVDALVADFPFCAVSILRFPGEGLAMLHSPLTIEPLGVALPPRDPLFVNLVENYLDTLEETGLLARLKVRWFSDGSWVSELR
ncbi:MAG: transporter substrate-binding domain-containing protein [Deltaproteobacteria bacterium]|nr:transporter substrate-binding domain-containing protein [Deltaproteobacteria bacterium]MBW2394000.1 transporter substrate-binding domain-containing protein [Deltaproteobacteria bacterium]